MPIFRVTVITTKICCGQRIDKGLSVDVQTYTYANPIFSPEKEKVAQAFLFRLGQVHSILYGDAQELFCLTTV